MQPVSKECFRGMNPETKIISLRLPVWHEWGFTRKNFEYKAHFLYLATASCRITRGCIETYLHLQRKFSFYTQFSFYVSIKPLERSKLRRKKKF